MSTSFLKKIRLIFRFWEYGFFHRRHSVGACLHILKPGDEYAKNKASLTQKNKKNGNIKTLIYDPRGIEYKLYIEDVLDTVIENADINVEVLIYLRNHFKICKKHIEGLTDIWTPDFNVKVPYIPPHVLLIAAETYFCHSFEGAFQDSNPDIVSVDLENYIKYLNKTFGVSVNYLVDFNNPTDNCLGSNIVEASIQGNTYLRETNEKYINSLKEAEMYSLSFKELFIKDEAFYYLDSPYWLTTGYNIEFDDEMHKEMLDSLRGSQFKWLFSMQYYWGIKEEGYYYISDYKEEQAKELYVILIDFDRSEEIGVTVGFKSQGNEMFVTNVNPLGVLPYSSPYCPISLSKFISLLDEELDYKDMVAEAKKYREEILRDYVNDKNQY